MDPPNRLAEDMGYKGKTILITGATGFLGKLLVEKILRTCPLVKKIYVIARSKKGKDPQERLNNIFADPIFELLKKTRGKEIISKVTVIIGEISEIGIGLSPENRKILTEEVQIIFHLAATTRFDEPFKKAVLINVRGTKSVLDLAKECKKLLVFAHISTAYSQPQEKVLYEKTYSSPANPEDIIKLVEMFDDAVIDSIAPTIIGKCPNSYAYTKALAEGLVNNEMCRLPVIILRPSIVMPILGDPIPGWVDSINGVTGASIASGKGVLRSIYGNSNAFADLVPADSVVSGIMLCTFHFMNFKEIRVFNLTAFIKMTWQNMANKQLLVSETMLPLNWVLWRPRGRLTSSRLNHNIRIILFQYIPAIILDCVIVLTGNRPVLWKIQKRITKSIKLLEYYTTNEWDFKNNNVITARNTLNETEKKIYMLDEEGLDHSYFYNCIHSTRLYLLKESDESIPTAKRHLKIIVAVDEIFKILMLIGFGYLVWKYIVFPIIGGIQF